MISEPADEIINNNFSDSDKIFKCAKYSSAVA